jgi:hypothetical protein
MRSPDLRFRFSLSRTNRSFRGQSFLDRRDSWFFAMVACSLAFLAFGPGRNAISSNLNSITVASGPAQRKESFLNIRDESFISFRYCSRPFVLRGAPMKTRGNAHLNQFWCHPVPRRSESSSLFLRTDLAIACLLVCICPACRCNHQPHPNSICTAGFRSSDKKLFICTSHFSIHLYPSATRS